MVQNNNGGSDTTTNAVQQPITSEEAKVKIQRENFEEKVLKDWLDKTFKDVPEYDEAYSVRAIAAVKAPLHAGSLPLQVGLTSGLFMYSALAVMLQIGLAMADKDLAKKLTQAEFVKFINWSAAQGVEWTNWNFERSFNHLAAVVSGKEMDYVGEVLSPQEIQKAVKKMREVADGKSDSLTNEAYDTAANIQYKESQEAAKSGGGKHQ